MKKSRYRSLFTVHTHVDPKTGAARKSAVYTGSYYRIVSTGAERSALLKRFTPSIALSVGIFLAYGFMDLPSTRYYLTLPFYVLMLPALFYWALSAVRIIRLPEVFTQVQRDRSLQTCTQSAYIFAALCGLFAAGMVVLLATGGAGNLWPYETLWAVAMLAAGALGVYAAKQAKTLQNQTQPIP